MQQKMVVSMAGRSGSGVLGLRCAFFLYYLILERLAFTTIHIPPAGILAIVDTFHALVVIL